MVCVVGKMRDLILQLSKSSIYSTKPGGTNVLGFNGQTNVNVIAELANGKTIIGRALWTVNVQEVESEDAVFDVRWEGRDVTEN
ncbi:hypothetical protein ELE18_09190 [Klebsiella quasipneumoniae]|nr:hypothetical protein ELE18_09190 [Klebsiella quasipneumoniae]